MTVDSDSLPVHFVNWLTQWVIALIGTLWISLKVIASTAPSTLIDSTSAHLPDKIRQKEKQSVIFQSTPINHPYQQVKRTTDHATDPQINSKTINQIMQQIEAYYINDVDVNTLLENAIQQVFQQLDPYSNYLNAVQMNELIEISKSQYNGLGIEVEIRNNLLVILTTIKDSPAEIAGLTMGDIIIAINDQSIIEPSLAIISKQIKDTPNQIKLTIQRDYYQEPIEFMIKKGKINVENVRYKLLKDHVAYLKVHSFQSSTVDDINKAIQAMNLLAIKPLTGLILDLRDNPGGELNSAIAVSDLFLSQGIIVSTKGRFKQANKQYSATAGELFKNKPIYVLINQGSASASEIVAGALKENQRATIVGMTSFGKGSVQSLIPIGNGSTAIKLTTALYFTPNGQTINGTGIQPHIEIPQQSTTTGDQQSNTAINSEWKISGKSLATYDFQLAETRKLVLQHTME